MTIVRRTEARPGHPVIDPADWTGDVLLARSDWRYMAADAEINWLVDRARVIAARLGDDSNRLLDLKRGEIDLGPFANTIAAMLEQVRDGPGIVLYRGLPMDDLSLMEAAVIYWAMGLEMGKAQSNNPDGDMIGHVLDTGRDYNDPRHRGYQTNVTMDYHCDQTDAVALLCINTAKTGGLSKVVSSVRLHNEILALRPDLMDVLTRPYCWTKHAEKDIGEQPYYESPVFNFLEGKLCVAYGPAHIIKGHALPEAPDMSERQREAIGLMADLAEQHHAAMALERGDIQICNNYTALHTRTGFRDWSDPARRRVLWRLWLRIQGFRPATPYSAQWADGVNLSSTRSQIRLIHDG